MENDQRNARIFGVLFLITFLTSIPALALYQPVLDDPAAYIAGGGNDNQIYLGALLELLLIIANVGTAVVVYPILRRQSEILSLGYVTARLVECMFIAAGIVFVLGIVSSASRRSECLGAGRIARRAQGLDVPARPRLHRRLGERTDTRLPDVQLPPGATGHGDAGPHRWATDHPFGDRRAVRRLGRRRHGAEHRDDPGVSMGVVARHLLRREGVQAGFSDSLAGRAFDAAGRRLKRRPRSGRVGRSRPVRQQ